MSLTWTRWGVHTPQLSQSVGDAFKHIASKDQYMIFFNTWQEEKQVEHKMRNRKPVSGGVEVVGRGAPPMFPLAQQMDLGLSVKLSV